MRLPAVKRHGSYGILLVRDWLRQVNYRDMVYRIRVGGKRAKTKQNRGSCEVLSAGEEESDLSEESSDESSDDEPKESDYSHVAHMAMVVPLDEYRVNVRTITAQDPPLGVPYAQPGADCLLRDAKPENDCEPECSVNPHGGSDIDFDIGASLGPEQRKRVIELLNRHPTVLLQC